MRLTCPSCGAQYEVPPEAIPPQGRDVQCSACGHGWFEQPAEGRPRLVDPESAPEPWDSLPREEGGEEEADDLAELQAAPPPPRTDPGAAAAQARARVAPEVERILREEAAREAEARAEEAARRALPEAAPEADRPPEPPRWTRRRETEESPLPASSPGPRPAPAARPVRPARQVDRKVDLDRINSTLRTHADHIGAKAPQIEPRRRRRGGFGSGFVGSLVILGLLAALYLFRLEIVEVVPQAAAVLDPYATVVDRARFWLDHEVGRLLGVAPGV